MLKPKISGWNDLCFIATILYSIFLLCGFFIDFNAVVQFGNKVVETKLNFFTWVQVNNKDLSEWKLWLMLGSFLVIAIIIDKMIFIPFFFKFTKQGKIYKHELNKKYREYKNEKIRKKQEKNNMG